jgi:hypothetical protein
VVCGHGLDTVGLLCDSLLVHFATSSCLICSLHFFSPCLTSPCIHLIYTLQRLTARHYTPLHVTATGTISIEPITEEFVRQQGEITEIKEFLSLPQLQPLRVQLDEAGELMNGTSRAPALYDEIDYTFIVLVCVQKLKVTIYNISKIVVKMNRITIYLMLLCHVPRVTVLSQRVSELGTAFGRAGLKIEAVELITRQLGTRTIL